MNAQEIYKSPTTDVTRVVVEKDAQVWISSQLYDWVDGNELEDNSDEGDAVYLIFDN